MKKSTHFFCSMALLGFFLTLSSCSDDEVVPDKPTVVIPDGIITATIGVATDFTFIADFPGGYQSHTFKVGNGSVILNSSEPASGAAKITLDISFTGIAEGAGAVTLTVTDQNGKTDTGTIPFNVVP